ncbi:MAG: indole-3-glycerol phosphate synthase TrpC [Gemmatimonadota bacterium]|nr:indole-3-glycerol phosphate synthase TrpC [Gemmatimonadota bacterium]
MPESQGAEALPGVLASIVRTKWEEVERLQSRRAGIERKLEDAPPLRGFRAALESPDDVSLIAECKRRSPGAGEIRPDLDPVVLTTGYERAGARALSVLTDGPYFGGSLEDLADVRRATSIPILRKDFTLSPLQILEARGEGADAVLLIARILSDEDLRTLHSEARALGMDVLVEVHDAAELARATHLGADLVGINNRDLSTFTSDLATTCRLLDDAPAGAVIVSESGIRSVEDVERLGAAGVDAILVGETLLRASDPTAAAYAFSGVARSRRSET